MAPNFQVGLTNLCSYEAEIDVIQGPQLPGDLPQGAVLVQALQILLTDDGQNVSPLPVSARITVEFDIPRGQLGKDFAILFWYDGEWVELDAAMTDDGLFSATGQNAGTFVLVNK